MGSVRDLGICKAAQLLSVTIEVFSAGIPLVSVRVFFFSGSILLFSVRMSFFPVRIYLFPGGSSCALPEVAALIGTHAAAIFCESRGNVSRHDLPGPFHVVPIEFVVIYRV